MYTSVIALWLGHVSVDTTQIYLHADMTLKEHPPDTLLAWLEGSGYANCNGSFFP